MSLKAGTTTFSICALLLISGQTLLHGESQAAVPTAILAAASTTLTTGGSPASKTTQIPAKVNASVSKAVAHPVTGTQAMHAAVSQEVVPGKDTTRDLTVAVGGSVVIDTARATKRITVGLGDYAEANAITPTQVLVNGKAPGVTTLILWDVTGAREFVNVTVSPDNTLNDDHLAAVRRELRTELPDADLKITAANGSVFLRGNVKDLNASDRAVQIASTAGKVVNLLYVAVPASQPQVLLKVRFASVDRSKGRQLGVNFFSTGLGNTIAGVNTGQFSPPSLGLPSSSSGATASLSNELNLFAFFPGLNVGAAIEAMESKGLVEVLAEPNLLAESGKKASFLAGGEYPYPVVQGTGTGSSAVTIQFKEYGVRLSFIPTVTARGTIQMQLLSEVSALDFTNAVELSGFQVPAIDTRNVRTEVELGEGQSFAIGGLLDNRETETFQKIPFLGSVPILGKLFQSISKTKNNTELMVIVTPEIVAPIPSGSPLPQMKYPDTFLPSNSGIPMHTPDAKTSQTPPPPPTMPVEQLIESLKPEKLLVDDTGASGANSGSQTGASTPK